MFDQAHIDSYTPSNELQEALNVYGRRRLRMLNGQDPELHPEKFTPLPDMRMGMQWPTNEEAYS